MLKRKSSLYSESLKKIQRCIGEQSMNRRGMSEGEETGYRTYILKGNSTKDLMWLLKQNALVRQNILGSAGLGSECSGMMGHYLEFNLNVLRQVPRVTIYKCNTNMSATNGSFILAYICLIPLFLNLNVPHRPSPPQYSTTPTKIFFDIEKWCILKTAMICYMNTYCVLQDPICKAGRSRTKNFKQKGSNEDIQIISKL